MHTHHTPSVWLVSQRDSPQLRCCRLLLLRVLLKPEKFEGELPRRARPPPKLMPYYVDYENRGEFSPQMQLQELQQRRNAAMTQSEE